MPIAVRELKASLSRVLLRVQAGEVITVTSHNRPIARIVGIAASAGDGGLRGLIAAGALSWNGSKPQLAPPLGLTEGVAAVGPMVLEDRG
ncbi:type II toxin-antitoxin system Phd/YefM family antitoxin [Candidatus Thiodictyon syntrophicum]|jgi:prevent-host-death family protein|uniref:Prevent-host-death protein n=1 Tax=Candidatus Thiodictyon syntrophicum TaxID=1166950 RepID=A0A2K8U2H7_9GAMM|nr:type II toxin-antitoxin system prevent-host-death family antitoxin [Candidatus Thiodictyon syntrophicum]AUB79783.1 prevent-host-death protein [Candidatus Thiodictyon syntrophicum]